MYQIPRVSLALLLIAMALVILPHVGRLPLWLTSFCALCGVWRIMVYQGRWSYPPTWVKAIFVVAGFSGVAVSYGTLLGLEPWVGVLIVAFVLKLIEMYQQRDAYVAIILAYFVALTEFLFEQAIPYALYVYLTVTVITAALIGLNQTELNLTPLRTFRKASIMMVQSIPLMLVLFVLFPRIAPLWTVPLQTEVAKTGVSDRMSPGSIAHLVQSDELAFRATFDGELPAYSELYWRGLVLSKFREDSQTWTQEEPRFYGRTIVAGEVPAGWEHNMEHLGREVKYNIMLEPTNQNWLFSLTLPEPTSEDRVRMVRDFRFFSFREIGKLFRYEVTSHLDYRIDRELSDFWRGVYLMLPDDDNELTKALGRQIRADSSSPEEFVANVMRHFATNDFAYTLRPPILEGDTIDDFMINSRRGFCEHFAGAFVYLMRAGGVPARIVVGYQGGEFNRRGNYVAVHQFDAHAWTEVWLQGQGWVRADPTSIVAPERIQSGLERAVAGEETFLADVGLSIMKFRSTLWLTELRLQLQAINHYWDAWVVGYTPDVQMSLINQYLGEISRATLGAILIGLCIVVLGITSVFLLLKRSQRKLSEVDKHYLAYCQILDRLQIPRQVGEGPLDYADRVIEAKPDLETAVVAVTRRFVEASFVNDTPEDAEPLKAAVRNFRVRALAS